MRFWRLLLLVLCLPLSAAAVASSDWADQVRALESSTWSVEVIGESRTRRLRLGRAADTGASATRIEAWYGWSDAAQPPVTASVAQVDGVLVLTLTTPARSTLEVSATGRRTLEGSFVPKDGVVRDARLTRLDAAAGTSPAARLPSASAQALSRVHMVYLGDDDCPPCRWWLLSDLAQLKQSPAFQQIRFNHVKKRIRGAVPPLAFLPDEVRPLKPQLDAANAGTPGSAQVAVFVDGRLHDYFFGTRTAPEVLDMLDAIATGRAYPFPRCLQISHGGTCARRPE